MAQSSCLLNDWWYHESCCCCCSSCGPCLNSRMRLSQWASLRSMRKGGWASIDLQWQVEGIAWRSCAKFPDWFLWLRQPHKAVVSFRVLLLTSGTFLRWMSSSLLQLLLHICHLNVASLKHCWGISDCLENLNAYACMKGQFDLCCWI